jgi:NUMOD4 motif/HNH endonuclease
MAAERWKPVVGLEGRYDVSDKGRVRSLGFITPNGGFAKGRILKQIVRRSAEVCIGGRSRKVHQLVLEAFRGPRPPGLVSLHRDDRVGNNRLSNLRYGTPLENARDALRNGRYRFKHGPDGRFMEC